MTDLMYKLRWMQLEHAKLTSKIKLLKLRVEIEKLENKLIEEYVSRPSTKKNGTTQVG